MFTVKEKHENRIIVSITFGTSFSYKTALIYAAGLRNQLWSRLVQLVIKCEGINFEITIHKIYSYKTPHPLLNHLKPLALRLDVVGFSVNEARPERQANIL